MAGNEFIRPAIVRGSLLHQVGAVQFAEFRRAACAWSAVRAAPEQSEADRLRADLAHARAEALVWREEADALRRQCEIQAQQIGKLQYQLRELAGGAQ